MPSIQTATVLNQGADLLIAGAKGLSGAGRIRGAENALTRGHAVGDSIRKILSGADAVRDMGGPFFGRLADDIVLSATRAHNNGPVGPAIDSAMDGANWLMRRASTLPRI